MAGVDFSPRTTAVQHKQRPVPVQVSQLPAPSLLTSFLSFISTHQAIYPHTRLSIHPSILQFIDSFIGSSIHFPYPSSCLR
ncbi:hypothetical protein AMATHDRAFT_65822, partial [Amanita thiersii Skay4041]